MRLWDLRSGTPVISLSNPDADTRGGEPMAVSRHPNQPTRLVFGDSAGLVTHADIRAGEMPAIEKQQVHSRTGTAAI